MVKNVTIPHKAVSFKRDSSARIGTCLQGYVDISYEKLVNAFGEPEEGDGYKTDAEWVLRFEDSTVATIYNYKDGVNYNGPEEGIPTELIEDWHIGGVSKIAVQRVLGVLQALE